MTALDQGGLLNSGLIRRGEQLRQGLSDHILGIPAEQSLDTGRDPDQPRAVADQTDQIRGILRQHLVVVDQLPVFLLLLGEGVLDLYHLGQIDDLGDEVTYLARFLPYAGDRDVHPDAAAVGLEEAFAQAIAGALIGLQLCCQGQVDLEVVGVGEFLPGAGEQGRFIPVQDPAEGGIDVQEAALRRHQAHPHSGLFHRQPEALLRLTQGPVGCLSGGLGLVTFTDIREGGQIGWCA